MGLKHLAAATEQVETSGGAFAVRGLSFDDIIVLVREHHGSLSALFDRLKATGGQLDLTDSVGLVTEMIDEAPAAAARIISLAADEEDTSIARKFAFTVQLDALEKIARLTFASEGGAKKVLEMIIRVASASTETIKALKA